MKNEIKNYYNNTFLALMNDNETKRGSPNGAWMGKKANESTQANQ